MMENNTLKTAVYSNQNIYCDSMEVPIDIDFTLPDYCPSVNRIFKCIVTPGIVSKNLNGAVGNIDGLFTVNIIYTDADNRICAYEHQSPFSRSFELGNDGKDIQLCAKIKMEYINCRAVTEKRIDIHGAASIRVKVFERQKTEIITDYDDADAQLKRECIPATTPMGYAEKYLMLEEEIEIGQAQLPVRTLLRYDTAVMIRECKLLNEKAIVKGEMIITALYNTDTEKIQTVRAVLPFSQLLEMSGAGDQCSCDAEVDICTVELKPRTGINGEIRSFSMVAKLLVGATAFCDKDIEAVLDAYSRKNELEVKKSDIVIKKVCKKINEVCHTKSEIAFSDITLSGISDIWCDVQNSNVKFSDEDIMINGKANACVIAIDDNGKPNFYDKVIDFECAFPIGKIHGACCEPDIEIKSVSYTMLGNDKIEVRLEIGIYACVYSVDSVPIITELKKGETRRFSTDRGAMTIYFAAAGEHVWDIACRYHSSVDEICQINDIKDKILASEKMILVPMI